MKILSEEVINVQREKQTTREKVSQDVLEFQIYTERRLIYIYLSIYFVCFSVCVYLRHVLCIINISSHQGESFNEKVKMNTEQQLTRRAVT